jgi:hypothetical protein
MQANVAIIGGSTGLGAKITEYVQQYLDPNPLLLGKTQGYSISTDDDRHSIKLMLNGTLVNWNYIIINAFDHSNVDAQEQMFEVLWERYKDSNVTFIVIGSTAKMWGWNANTPMAKEYSKAKERLYKSVFYKTWDDKTTARSILIEPSFVQNVVDYFEDKGQLYLAYEDFIGMLEAAVQMSFYMKLVCISGKGIHPASEFKS